MSIKKLFESTEASRNYLAATDQKEAFKDVESSDNVAATATKQSRFIPQIDYSDPANFVKYGSAQLYYKSAVDRITDYYPYDGSEYEKTEFHNESLDIEEYVFDNLYPRTNGYALLCADGWGSRSSLVAGYGLPSDLEYIAFQGGPHTITSSTAAGLFPDDDSVKRAYANLYETNVYTTASLPSNYGSGSRESNLQCDFNRGVTIEFWMKKDAWTYDAEASTSTYKEVMFDLWNGGGHDNANGDHNYGRITLTGDPWQNPTTPLLLTVRSGSTGWNDEPICTTALTASAVANGAWQHYAVTIKNSGSQLVAKLYVSGTLEKTTVGDFGTLGELPSKTSTSGALGGRLGALITTVSAGGNPGAAGSAKLSASLDEFRFWKVARTGQEIKDYWFTQVRGGTNTDISNTTLGVYYKFNAGITGTSSIDNAVLDYSGRLTNGNWVGYDSYSRSTNSAIVEASASSFEFKDPIVRSNHPDVVNLKEVLQETGVAYDLSNNAAFKTLVPSWVLEEEESDLGTEFVPPYHSNLEKISHVVGAYFDKLRLQIKAFPTFKHLNYTSASHMPLPFAQHLPQSLGLYMPELFIDSTVLERFMNRNSSTLFEGSVNETKNLIYQNIYNNLTHIYKSKGTEKSIRNVFRCFNLDDKLVRLNVYANNEIYELKDNLRQTLINKKTLNFSTASNLGGVVYQAHAVSPNDGTYSLTKNWWSTYAGGAAAPSYNNLQGWWRLDADVSSAGDITDDSGHTRDGTFDASGDRPGQSTALYPSLLIQSASCTFDGSDDAINIGTGPTWDEIIGNNTDDGSTQKMSFSAWIYKTGDGGSNAGRIIQLGRGSTGEIILFTTATEVIKFSTYWNSADSVWETAAGAFSLNTWTHIGITYDASSTSNTPIVYVNGAPLAVTQTGTAPASSWNGISPLNACYIGNHAGGAVAWEGQLADVAVWDGILSWDEMRALYNAKTSVGLSSYVAETLGYISGSNGAGIQTAGETVTTARGYEFPYGFTAETDMMFPRYNRADTTLDRQFPQVSLFGMCSASTDNGGARPLNDTTWYPNDAVSFQVYAIKNSKDYKDVFFKLTSSLTPDTTTDLVPFPELTSSYFYDVYDNTNWNLSVRLKPSNFGVTNMVSGAHTSDYTYDLVFSGYNHEYGTIQNSFTLTASVSKTAGENFLKSAKRLYVGARRHNVTGANGVAGDLSASCDVLFNSAKYWTKYLDDLSLKQHAYDIDNSGISGSWRDISPLDPNLSSPAGSPAWIDGTAGSSGSILNSNMLALDWRFNNVTSSDANGAFYVEDYSSGSALLRDNYGWVGKTTGYQHAGSGSNWPVSSQAVMVTQSVNAFQFINPEYAVSSDMIKILTDDDKYFGIFETPPNYRYVLEKSMYNAVSEEMLDFFAGAVDFNNLIGEPVNRYRGRYKRLEKLREIFFQRVKSAGDDDGVAKVEKFIEYYKWFDDAIAEVVGQLIPASTDFTADIYNTIESHVLERNKYRSKYPSVKIEYVDPAGSAWGSYEYAASPLPGSPRPTNQDADYWKNFADRTDAEITSNDATVDGQRNNIRDIVSSQPTYAESLPTFTTVDGVQYQRPLSTTGKNSFAKVYGEVKSTGNRSGSIIHGGVNFEGNKSLNFTYNALRPGGPVNTDNSVFVPLNVLYADIDDMVPLDEITANVSKAWPQRKLKRVFSRVQHGRDWQNGSGYSNTKSTFAFPFNIMSSSVWTGYNNSVVKRVSASLEIVNLHNDVYGPNMEVPMQGVFTDHNVGGHQSRHVPLNTGSVLDTHLTRPEAWKLLLGKCPNSSGALGMGSPDYPWPEANESDVIPYPMTGAQKAIYYRGYTAKRPVNIRNIIAKTGSTTHLGNYIHNYEVVQAGSSFANPRRFMKQQPELPAPVVTLSNQVVSASTNVVSFYPTLYRTQDSHFDFNLTYAPWQFTGSNNQSTIMSRFGAPGGPDTMSRGFLDIRGAEYSVYNSLSYRNWSVIKPFQASGSISEATGSGVPGIRVSDQTGRDYGLRILLGRHSARFGRDSRFETATPGATYNQLPSFQKVNRNTMIIIDSSSAGYATGAQYDNAFVSHPIPRSDRQYSWMSATVLYTDDIRINRFAPTLQSTPEWLLGYFSSSTGYIPYFDFVSGTNIETTTGIYQPNTRLNILTVDPVTASATNIIGLPTASDNSNYFNSAFIDVLPAADSALITGSAANYFNLLMARRGNNFGWSWKKVHQGHNPIFEKEISGANISLTKVSPKTTLTNYRLTPVSMKGRPVYMNFTAPVSSETDTTATVNAVTIKTLDSIYRIGTSNTDLDDFLELPLATVDTPYDSLLSLVKDPTYTLNWLLYTQGVYPSDYNELYEATFTRTGFSNNFWNDSRTGTPSRDSIGGTFNNSFDRTVSQSSWVLDAQENFLTRTKLTLPSPSWNSSSAADDGLINSGAAGELQNNYFFYFDTPFSTAGPLVNADEALAPGALYARKHMLTTPQAVSPWNNIAEVGEGRWNKGEFNSSSMTNAPEPYAGEALWEADTQAGYIIKSEGSASFQAHPSKPWFNNYDDFKYELKLVAKDYSIVPEFRISENIEDYVTYGIGNSSLTDTFTIPGTSLSSSQDSFYKDYSNSEFLKEFINIPSETNLSASEIKLVMSAAIRFNPYKGFYPAQRTIDIVRQFSRSFGSGIVGKAGAVGIVGGGELFTTSGSLVRPLAQPLFAPGILYNTIKAGMAVDYPILLDDNIYTRYGWTGSSDVTDNWALSFINGSTLNTTLDQYGGGAWFDQRLPFEAIIEPDKYINGLALMDCEPHPSCSLNATASWSGEADDIYTKMVSNFFGEIPKFFLADGTTTTLESGVVTDDLVFEEGATYGARVKLLRSADGIRNYNFEKASDGAGTGWGKLGFTAWSGSAAAGRSLAFSTVPVPQDPVKSPSFKPLFQPYSRPTAFGPPIAGRPEWGNSTADAYKYAHQGGEYGVRDSFSGVNPAFTPPYTDGQCWFDLVFTPIVGETYDLERIMTETSGVYWRFDRGPERYTGTMTKYQNIPACQTGSDDPGPPYGGANINANSMQLSASFNLFGVSDVTQQSTDEYGNLISDTNVSVGKKWVIQSKFETPLMNFTDADPVHPITDANGTLTLPAYGDQAVPRGMWHQFGVGPSDANTGMFLSIEDIDNNWLKYHYDVINNDTVYNRKDYVKNGTNMYAEMQSLSTLLGFDQTTSKKRMGQLAEKQTIKEAVVAVPYITERILQTEMSAASGSLSAERKLFIEIPQNRFEAALAENKGTAVGDSLDTAGASIRYLLQKMERYVLPPEFDFINNTDITPVVMYMFEFEYELDKDDLAYIWQNLAPRNYQKLQLTSTDVAHELIDNELMSGDMLQHEDLRWMVFKVKQRGMTNYFDDIVKQAGESSDIADASSTSNGYDLNFNWPYDFVSIVEMAKLDVQVLYKADTGITTTDDNHSHTYSINNDGDGTTSYDDGHYHEITNGMVQEADNHTHTLENGT